jgi:hypothetical protein
LDATKTPRHEGKLDADFAGYAEIFRQDNRIYTDFLFSHRELRRQRAEGERGKIDDEG